jgi:RND family efflux transporter MFP subunit
MILFRKITFYIALISLVFMGLQVWRLSRKPPEAPPLVQPPVKPESRGIGAAGLVEAIHDNTQLGAPVAGIVSAVFVDVGDQVKKDQPLFEIDDRDIRAQLAVQQANLKVAQAQLKRVSAAYQRVAGVSDPYAVTRGEVSTRADDVEVARAQVEAARAAVEASQTMVDRMTVRSPIDGRVLQMAVSVGEFVSPQSQTPPMVLGNVSQVQVRADVDEQIAPRIVAGKNAVGYIKGEPDRPIPLTFVRIEPLVVPKRSLTGMAQERVDTRVLQVIFKFDNPPDKPVYVGQQMDLYIEE